MASMTALPPGDGEVQAGKGYATSPKMAMMDQSLS